MGELRNEEFQHFCSSPDIISVMKLRMMRWVRYVAHMGEKRNQLEVKSSLCLIKHHDMKLYGEVEV
jgi:hypothetical protein